MASIVNCVHGRRTGRVDSEARTVQVESIVDPVADDAHIDASSSIVVSEVALENRHLLIVASETGNVYGRVGTGDIVQLDASIFQAFVRHLQHLALLWIEPLGLDGRHVEEGWVEVLEFSVQEIASHR